MSNANPEKKLASIVNLSLGKQVTRTATFIWPEYQ